MADKGPDIEKKSPSANNPAPKPANNNNPNTPATVENTLELRQNIPANDPKEDNAAPINTPKENNAPSVPKQNNAAPVNAPKENNAPSVPKGNNTAASTPKGNNAAASTPKGNNAAANTPKGNNAAANTPKGNNAKPVNTPSGSLSNKTNEPSEPPCPCSDTATKGKPIFWFTQGKAWDGATSSFGSLAFLSIFPLTGFLGLDHVYLRSPASALLKATMNILTFGLWYFYDAAQILSERPLVEKYGYSYPIVGPTGLGAGILQTCKTAKQPANEGDGPSPWRFVLLCLFAALPIPFGLEYFVVGDTWGGITKLISNFMFSFGILQFFSILSGMYFFYRVYFKTESMIHKDGIPRTFPWTVFMDSDYCPAGTISPPEGCKPDKELGESQGWLPFMFGWIQQMKWYKTYVGMPLQAAGMAYDLAKDAVQAVIPPAAAAAAGATSLAAQAPTIESKVESQAQAKYTDANSIKELYKKQAGQAGGGSKPAPEAGAGFFQNLAFALALGVTVATGVYLAKLPSLSEVDVSFILPFSKRKSASGPDDTPPQPATV